jgi:hydrogenase maturation protease
MTQLLIGLGNLQRGDDSVGIAVVRRVAEIAANDLEVVESDDPASLIDTWSGAERAVVVDAMKSDRPAGSVLTLDVTETSLPADGGAKGGTHSLGLAAAVELSRALGRLPRRLVVVGVEVDGLTAGSELSPAVQASVEAAAAAALRALTDEA